MHLVDLDGDGDLDYFLSAYGKGDTPATLNEGFAHFTRVVGIYTTSEIHLCYDSDEDGRIDLTIAYRESGGQWWWNKSSPGESLFEPPDIMRDTSTALSQLMIDINRDGNVDWLRSTDIDIQFDFGDGNGFFSESTHRLPVTRERDGVRIYDGALSDAEIWSLYGNGSQR